MGGGSRGTGRRRRRLRRAQRRAPALGLALAACLWATLAPARARADGRIRGSVTLVAGGASNAWLEPGPQAPEGLGLVVPALSLSWSSRRLGLEAGYAFLGTRYLAAQVTGLEHDAHLGATVAPGDHLHLGLRLAGQLVTYDATGPAATTATLPILATTSRAATLGLSLRWRPGALALSARWAGTLRHSDATLPGSGTPIPVDEVDHEASVSLRWRPGAGTVVRLGPVLDLRLTGAPDLAYTGAGVRVGVRARPWPGGGVEAALRTQENVFQGTYARTDLFARLRIGVSQALGAHLRLRITYAYTANGSDLAAFDADRHLVLVSLAAGTRLLDF